MSAEEITAITALVSIILSGILTFYSLRRASRDAQLRSAHEFAMTVAPRRLEAVEEVWIFLFEMEAGVPMGDARTEKLIRSSLWLPEALRENVLAVATSVAEPATQALSKLRTELVKVAGLAAIDKIQAKTLEAEG